MLPVAAADDTAVGSVAQGDWPVSWRQSAERHASATSAEAMKLVADDVQSVLIPGAGHWLAEEAPEEFLTALTAFLAPYRDG